MTRNVALVTGSSRGSGSTNRAVRESWGQITRQERRLPNSATVNELLHLDFLVASLVRVTLVYMTPLEKFTELVALTN